MNRRTLLLLFALLLNATFPTLGLETRNATRDEERATPVQHSLEKSSSSSSSIKEQADRFPLEPNSTTITTITTMETYRKLTLSINGENVTREEFRPSFHLGEIKESRINDPFDAPRRFNEGGATRDESYDSKRLALEPIGQNLYETVEEEGRLEGARKDRVTFRDEVPGYDRGEDTQSLEPQGQQIFEQGAASWGKPSKFHSYADSTTSNAPFPYSTAFHDRPSEQAGSHDFQKPGDGLVYVQESSFTRTRTFPYTVYQPHGYQQVDVVGPSYPVKKRASPWTKILHLIGTILPLGLLIAALTPNVVKVDNATQPNIVLSKWRVAELPVEHKQARFADTQTEDCEERSVCRVILAGGDAGSTVLQNILWNLATRTSTATAKKSGLHEVFKAVKKRDCTNVPCQSPL